MDKALQQAKASRQHADGSNDWAGSKDWRKRMSDHVAYALLVYTALQIFVTMSALKTGHGSILPYFALIVLVAAIIPACRFMEKKWEGVSDFEAHDPALRGRFTRDAALLWACAILLPLLLTGGFLAAKALLG